MATTTRTYQKFSVRWADGSTWSGYETYEEAQAVANRGTRDGYVIREVFELEVNPSANLGITEPKAGDTVRVWESGTRGGWQAKVICPARNASFTVMDEETRTYVDYPAKWLEVVA